jgi:hypothetical protein
MTNFRLSYKIHRCLVCLLALLVLVLVAGAPRTASGQDLPALAAIDARLTRGTSTKSDVVLVFGQPQGTGGAFIPTDKIAKDIWYYENVKIEMMAMKSRQQVLLIFFRGKIYDGYFWFDINQTMGLK